MRKLIMAAIATAVAKMIMDRFGNDEIACSRYNKDKHTCDCK
jgi:hypothetical protein